MARNSWLAEQRMTNAHFFEQDPQRLYSQVEYNIKRIVKDIYNNLIDDRDYVYFNNVNFLMACKKISYDKAVANTVIANSLYNYISIILPQGMAYNRVQPGEYENAQNQYAIATAKASVWNIVYTLMCNIEMGADPKYTLSGIRTINLRQLNVI